MAKKKSVEQKKGNKFQWFFFVIVVPTIFAITLTFIVLTLLGVNVVDYAQKYGDKIPGVSSMVSTTEEKEQTKEADRLRATLEDNNTQIDQLKQEVENKQATINQLNEEITNLKADLAAKAEADKEQKNKVTDLASSFQSMDPKGAASVLENMELALAVQVAENIPSEEFGEILDAMNPEKAADISSSLMGSPPSSGE